MKQVAFIQIAVSFDEGRRENVLYGLTKDGVVYRHEGWAEGWRAIPSHRYLEAEPEKLRSKSMGLEVEA